MPDLQNSDTATGATLFERMQQFAQAPHTRREDADIPSFLHQPTIGGQNLVVINVGNAPMDRAVRFDRAIVAGQPGVVMKLRDEGGVWCEAWSMPTHSIDAREGMIGWLASQRYRWDRFAQMLDRKGTEALTNWIFELMVVPSTAQARPPRFAPQPYVTIDQYARPAGDHYRTSSGRRTRHRRDCL